MNAEFPTSCVRDKSNLKIGHGNYLKELLRELLRCLYGRESTELVSIWFVFQFYFALYLHVLYFYFSFHRLS